MVENNLQSLIDWIEAWAKSRMAQGRATGGIVRLNNAVDVYAPTDLACILYTIGRLNLTPAERDFLVQEITKFQKPETGEFITDGQHRVYHTTAFAVAALELLNARPSFAISFLQPLLNWTELELWLAERGWTSPGNKAGHDIPALASTFAVMNMVPMEWYQRLFDWLDEQQDPTTGLWRRGLIAEPKITHLVAAFHFLFVYEHFQRPICHADAMITSVLQMQLETGSFTTQDIPGFVDLDAAYVLARASRVAQSRRSDVKAALTKLARYTKELLHDVQRREQVFADTHNALGTIACLATLQEVVPAEIDTEYPLQLVLDRRPFI